MPPGYNYAWPVNGSLMLISSSLMQRLTNKLKAQFLVRTLWDVIPKHSMLINDPNVMVAFAPDTKEFPVYLLINGTKMPFLGGLNQTSNFGISDDRIVQTNWDFLSLYPTGAYIPEGL